MRNACEKFETVTVMYWVNVSESFSVGLLGLSQIRAIKCSS